MERTKAGCSTSTKGASAPMIALGGILFATLSPWRSPCGASKQLSLESRLIIFVAQLLYFSAGSVAFSLTFVTCPRTLTIICLLGGTTFSLLLSASLFPCSLPAFPRNRCTVKDTLNRTPVLCPGFSFPVQRGEYVPHRSVFGGRLNGVSPVEATSEPLDAQLIPGGCPALKAPEI